MQGGDDHYLDRQGFNFAGTATGGSQPGSTASTANYVRVSRGGLFIACSALFHEQSHIAGKAGRLVDEGKMAGTLIG